MADAELIGSLSKRLTVLLSLLCVHGELSGFIVCGGEVQGGDVITGRSAETTGFI